jgi:hypothetical protein
MFNQSYIVEVVNSLYYLIITVSILIMFVLVYSGLKGMASSNQMSTGMNRSGASAGGWWSVAGGLLAGKAGTIGAMALQDLGATQSFTWTPMTTHSNPVQFVGEFIIYAFALFGIGMIIKCGHMLPMVRTGEHKLSAVLYTFGIALAMISIKDISNEIATATPFNPLALFIPGSPVIKM